MSEGIVELKKKEKSVYRVQGFSCANCAGKFENNVKKLPEVQDAKVNFGASKISVYGSATVEELEEAGAFENLKVVPEKSREESGEDKKEKEVKLPVLTQLAMFWALVYYYLFQTLHFQILAALYIVSLHYDQI